MLNTLVKTAEEELLPADIPKILDNLADSDWTPAIYTSKKKLFDLAGLEDFAPEQVDELTSGGRRAQEFINGDLFFNQNSIFYFITNVAGEQARQGPPFYRPSDDAEPTVEIGMLNRVEKEEREELITEFGNVIEQAINESLDGRKTRYMDFNWRELQFESDSVQQVISSIGDQSEVEFNNAQIEERKLRAAEALADKERRETLINLSQSGFARESDVIVNREDSERVESAMEKLVENGLLNEEYLLECKQTGSPLTRLDTPEKLENDEIGNLRCASCGSAYREENVSKGYLPSDLGRELIGSSHWMEVWVTSRLVDSGVNLDSIYWNMAESGEEIDIAVDVLGQLWIFELKDREFGPGDAYPLNYRQSRYGADRMFIVTTEKVSENAKQVFEEAVRESRGSRKEPVYIEGLDETEGILEREINNASIRYASYRLGPLSQVTGFDIGKLLSDRLNQPSGMMDHQDDELPF